MRVTWNQLRLFEAVARNNSFTRAAEELFVVQPTVSAQIKQLTDMVGLPLFEQVGKKIYLTDAGKELQVTCRELFDSWERFEMRVSDLKGVKEGRLRIAMATTAKYFVPRMLGPFYKRYPGVDLAVEIVNRDRVIERLVNNMDDLYIMGVPPDHIAIEKHLFLDNPLVVIAPIGHELARRKNVPLARLEAGQQMVKDYGEFLPAVPLEQMRRVAGEQEIIATYEPDKAIAALPALLPRREDRERLLTLLERLEIDARVRHDGITPEQRTMLQRVRRTLGRPAAVKNAA